MELRVFKTESRLIGRTGWNMYRVQLFEHWDRGFDCHTKMSWVGENWGTLNNVFPISEDNSELEQVRGPNRLKLKKLSPYNVEV
jgi:hypothetical protein